MNHALERERLQEVLKDKLSEALDKHKGCTLTEVMKASIRYEVQELLAGFSKANGLNPFPALVLLQNILEPRKILICTEDDLRAMDPKDRVGWKVTRGKDEP